MLAFAEKYGRSGASGDTLIPVRLTQGDIADLVGASRKRVNQVMVTFKQQGYILGYVIADLVRVFDPGRNRRFFTSCRN